MGTPLENALEDFTPYEVLCLTELLYAQVRATVAAGTASKEDIRACNTARKEINECRKLGMGA